MRQYRPHNKHKENRGVLASFRRRFLPHIKVGDNELNAIASFTYLGSTIARNCTIDNKFDARIAKANAALGRLRQTSGTEEAFV